MDILYIHRRKEMEMEINGKRYCPGFLSLEALCDFLDLGLPVISMMMVGSVAGSVL